MAREIYRASKREMGIGSPFMEVARDAGVLASIRTIEIIDAEARNNDQQLGSRALVGAVASSE